MNETPRAQRGTGRDRHDPVRQLNDYHAAELLEVARALTGHGDAVAAVALSVDETGIALQVTTPDRTDVTARVGFAGPVSGAGRRLAFRSLVMGARRSVTVGAGRVS